MPDTDECPYDCGLPSCPYTCTEDHNHPESNRAKWAKLDRTEKLLVVLVCAVFAGAAGLAGYALGYGLAALIRLVF